MEERNKQRLKDQNKEAVMLPKFAASFRASTDISSKYHKEFWKLAATARHFPAANLTFKLTPLIIIVAVKGLGADMLKEKTGRRRTKQQVKADKLAAAEREKQLADQEKLLAGLGGDPA